MAESDEESIYEEYKKCAGGIELTSVGYFLVEFSIRKLFRLIE